MNILITGTSSGVGYGLAQSYLQKGHEVYGISRSHNEALDAFSNFHFLSQDLAAFDEIAGSLEGFLGGVGSLGLVILNAGVVSRINDMKDTSLEEIRRVMDINVWSNKVLIDALFDTVPEIGQVVAISSGAAVSGSRGWNAYSLSKATLNMLIDLYAKEHPETHFTALAPGIIDTGMQDYIYSIEEEEKFPVVQKLKSLKGTDKMPSPEKAAPGIADAISRLKKFPSGSFQDVRDL
ncbi:MAG: SDR family NAD(P)-dependent oxidoreductase [Bacteroidales bacterium]|nr:SDR family NAD(P)-dependent oxidoreductase [Bacteroidales bacterium]MDT8432323.1 SDR family NAD(P)-dependent oxidoreductase [Bacteroidales bacterium]